MSRRIVAVTAAAGIAATLAVAAPGDLARVSVQSDGTEAATGGFRGVTAGDGRYVLFVSGDSLAGVPTGGTLQLYARDRVDGRTVLVSATAAGAVANQAVIEGDFFNPFADITPDGRYAVFASAASNLVAGDGNGVADVFRKDLRTGEVQLVSVSATGAPANAAVGGDTSISADGTRVAYTTGAATNLVPGTDGNAAAGDVVVRDLLAGTTTLASANSQGVQANDFTERPSISADGNVVAFEAGPDTTNLYAGDVDSGSGGVNDPIVKNLGTGVATPVAVVDQATVVAANVLGGNNPDISGDGRYVAFQTSAKLDPANDTNAHQDVYLRDTQTGRTTLVSARNGVDAAGNQDATVGRVSADGARVAFASAATDLVTGDGNAATDVFRRTLATRDTTRASTRADGTEATQGAETPGMSDNGGVVVFTGQAQYTPESGADDDVFVREAAPTDATAPQLTVDPVVTSGDKLRVTGRVEDAASGVGAVRVAGTTVRVSSGGLFSAQTAPSAGGGRTDVEVIAMDGAGNQVSTTASYTASSPGTGAPPAAGGPGAAGGGSAGTRARVRMTRVSITRRQVRVTMVVSAPARLLATLDRRVVRRVARKRPVVRWVTTRRRGLRVTSARMVVIALARPRPGTYRVRIRATNAAGATTATRRVVVRAVARRAPARK